MPEVARPGHQHRGPRRVRRGDALGVPDRASRLGKGRDARLEAGLDGIGEREERVRAARGVVGLGALTMVLLRSGLDIPVPFDLWDMQFQMAWLPAVIVATAVGVVAALVIGIPALRVRGLFLAVITLAFAVMCSNWLFRQSTWTGSQVRHDDPAASTRR